MLKTVLKHNFLSAQVDLEDNIIHYV